MTIKFSLPRDTATPVKFLGYLTVKDIIRLGLPTGIATWITYNPDTPLATLIGAATGLLIGTLWTLIRFEDEAFDVHLYHFIRQQLNSKYTEPVEIEKVEDRFAATSTGTLIGVIKVQPVSLTMQGEREQKALHSVLEELYETISFPIEIHSRQLPLRLDSYIQQLEEQEPGSDYTRYVSELNKGDSTTTHHYIIARANPQTKRLVENLVATIREEHDQLEPVFEFVENQFDYKIATREQDKWDAETVSQLTHRLDVVEDQLNRGSLEAMQITGIELQQYVNSFKHQIQAEHTTYNVPNNRVGSHRKTVAITEYPSKAPLGWPLKLLNQNGKGRVDIVQRITPVNQSKAVRRLERHIDRLDVETQSRLGGGLIKDVADLNARREDAEHMLELAADNTQSLVKYSTYITAHGNTPSERDEAFTQVKTRLDTLLTEYQTPVFRTDQAAKTESILYTDPLNKSRLMPSSSAACGFPFATSNRNEGSGIIYGTSTRDQSPVLLNHWNWSSHSMAILGKTGSGKSYYAKTLLQRWTAAHQLDQVIVVDPKNEYTELIHELNGTVETIEQDKEYRFKDQVIGFQVKDRGDRDNAENLTQLVREIYSATSQSKGRTIVVIEEAHNILRRKQGREALEQFIREARDTQTSVVMISQNADDFASNLEGRNILKNLEAVFLMQHSEVADDVIDFFQLSNRETTELQKLKTGTKASYSQALMKVSDRLDSKIKVEATPREHHTITEGGGS